MNVPALAAFAPDGPTQTIVGILECSAASMRSIASSAAAERVQLDDHGGGAVDLGTTNRPGHVVRHDVVHDPARRDDDDFWPHGAAPAPVGHGVGGGCTKMAAGSHRSWREPTSSRKAPATASVSASQATRNADRRIDPAPAAERTARNRRPPVRGRSS